MNATRSATPARSVLARTRRAVVAACVLSASAHGVANAQSDSNLTRLLLDRQLNAEPIDLIAIDGDRVVYRDAQGRQREARTGGVVAILPDRVDAKPRTPRVGAPSATLRPARRPDGALTLADGQRFPGRAATSSGEGDAVAWSHERFGQIIAPLDDVLSVVYDNASAPAAVINTSEPLFKDQLVLTNGDRFSGFVVSLGDPVEIETDEAGIVTAPRDRVAAARLATPQRPLAGVVVWLNDGSVAVLASVEAMGDDGVLLSLPTGQQAHYALPSVQALAFDAGRLVPLASIDPSEQTPVGGRALLRGVTRLSGDAATAPLGASDLELPGPMRATWPLPQGAVRFAGRAELPMSAWPWGDCEVVVRVDGVELLRERLRPEDAVFDFNLPVGGSSLSVEVEPGERGPVQDRVVLRRPLLLLDE